MFLLLLLWTLVFLFWIWLRTDTNKDEPPTMVNLNWRKIYRFTTDTEGFWSLIKEMSLECQKLDGVMKVPLGPRTVYVLTNPEDCLTVSNACLQKDSVYDFAKNWIGDGLITASVPIWKMHRKLLDPLFSARILNNFMEVFNTLSRVLIKNLEVEVGKGPFDPYVYSRRQALELICSFVFEPLAETILKIRENNTQFTDQNIREHVDTFIGAGEDTSAGVIMFCLVTVGSYPRVQKEIHKELKQIFGDEDRDVTKEDLSKLVYLEAVIKETMRFYPIVPIIARKLDKDVKLSNCTLSKGRSAVISIYGIHRHPMWGPDTDEFRPERWLDLPSSSQKYFAAFSLGRRVCIGIWAYWQKLSKEALKQGGTLKTSFGPRTAYVVSDPEDFLTVSNACFQKDALYSFAKGWLGDGLITAPSSKFKPYMNLLLEYSQNQKVFTDREIREHVETIIAAGEDTSAGVAMYCLLLVGAHPRVQQKIYEELKQVFGDEDKDVVKEDLTKLVYLEAVIKESMRIYPVISVIGRYIDKDVKLRNCTLSKGRTAFLSIYGVHRHQMWGPDVEEFKPERWLHPSTLPSHSNAFAGFSMGRRTCIGNSIERGAQIEPGKKMWFIPISL
ncbi:unnamed protein product [Danaus chrysippus]|uniref:(African queen) hypothetical protein n=1 Tax=Danaus chrysippus TaxID=151541 RepID=A0A8J2QV90_9NEOP|nr:unnamed protein product [Danaus chrysippus]